MTVLPPEVLAEAARDPDLQERAKRLMSTILDEAEYLLRAGTPAIKMQLIRSGLAVVMKELKERSEDESVAIMRTALAEMIAEMKEPHIQDAIDMSESAPPLPPDMPPPHPPHIHGKDWS